jgi:hypothetical protein
MGSFPSLNSLQPQQPDLINQPISVTDKATVTNALQDLAPAPLLAYANRGGVEGSMVEQPLQLNPDASNKIALAQNDDILGKFLSIGTPDYTVIAHSGLNSNKLSIGSFALINPLTNTYTYFASAKGRVKTPMGVLDVVYSRNLATGQNQAGIGKTFATDAGKPPKAVAFINIQGSFPNVGKRTAIAAGVFGNLAALPKGNAIINALQKSKGSVGVGWNGYIENLGGGKYKVVVSGVDITSLFTGQDGKSPAADNPGLQNYGNKPQAKYNNYQAYMTGANPYALAATSKGLNHGDQLAAFGNRVEAVRKDLESMGVYSGVGPIGNGTTRTNTDAGKILEVALSPGARERYAKFDPTGKKWENVVLALSFIGSNGYSEKFSQGNPEVRQLTGNWPLSRTAEKISPNEKPFIDDVLTGTFRKQFVEPSALQKAYDLLVGVDFGGLIGNDPVGGKYEFPGNLRPEPIINLFFKNDWSQKTLRENYGKDPRATAQLDFIKANTSAEFVRQFSSQPGKAFGVSTDGGTTTAAMCKYLTTDRGPVLVIQMVGADGRPSSPSVGYGVKSDGSLAYP